MSKWFTWEPSTGGSLLFTVTRGDKKSTWKVRKSTSKEDLYQTFTEMARMLDDGEHTPRLMPMHRMVHEGEDFQDSWEKNNPAANALSEEESLAALRMRAESLNLAHAGGKWWDGEAEDLPFRLPGQKPE